MENMGNSPYRGDYQKTRRLKIMILLIGLPLVLAATLLIVRGRTNRDIAEKSEAAPVSLQESGKTYPSEPEPSDSPAAEPDRVPGPESGIGEEFRKALDELLPQMNGGEAPEESEKEKIPDETLLETEPGEEPETRIVDLFNHRRFNLSVRWQMRGGVDIFVTDSYTGEMRIRHNYIDDKPLVLFHPEPLEGERRFFGLIERLREGGSSIFMIDSFTSEIRGRANVIQDQSISFFPKPAEGKLTRYSAQIIYNSGKIDVFVQDDCTSETRFVRGLDRIDSLALFSESDRQAIPGLPHFSAWTELEYGGFHHFALDDVSGDLRIKRGIDNLQEVALFSPRKPDFPCRYSGWLEMLDNRIVFYGIDMYTGQLKLFSDLEGKTEIKLFDWPLDDKSWPRYSMWVSYLYGKFLVYTFDSVTAKVTVDTVDSLSKPYRGVPVEIGPGPDQSRYQVQPQILMKGGVDVYVIDTFTGEVRIARSILGKKTVSTF